MRNGSTLLSLTKPAVQESVGAETSMKRIAFLLALFFAATTVFAQSLEFSPGERHVDGQGRVTHSSATAWFNSIRPSVRANLVSRTGNGEEERFIVLTVPTLTLRRVSSGSEFQIEFEDGEAVSFRSSEDSSVAQENGNYSISSIHIPYRITDDQVVQISSKVVKKMRIEGVGKTLDFSPKVQVSAIIKRQNEELQSLIGGNALAQSNSPARKDNGSRQHTNTSQPPRGTGVGYNRPVEKLSIHDTPTTKVVKVQNLGNMHLYPVREDAFFVSESGTGLTYIFNKQGEQLAQMKLDSSTPYTRGLPYGFSDDRALVRLENGNLAIIDSRGQVINDLKSVDRLVPSEEYSQFNDGLSIVYIASERKQTPDEFFMGYIPGDYKYLDKTGRIVRPDLSVRVVGESFWRPRPLNDGRRLHHDDKTGEYGFLDGNGNTAISLQYPKAHDFSEGLATVAIKRGEEYLWGFIDTTGNWVIEPMFSYEPQDFHEGFAVVRKKNRKYVFIDKQGKVCSDEYDAAFRFFNGLAMTLAIGAINGQFINTSFEIQECTCPKIRDYSLIQYCESTKTFHLDQCVYSYSGELLTRSTEPFYTDVTVYYENNCPKGYVNLEGEVILRFEESEF